MSGLFAGFDFKLLDDPEFGEDSVREELVAPLLAALGFSASPPYRIIRSRKLEHPFVHFGTVPKHITIIPDYLLERDGQLAWILDAKGPRENIDRGKNVEQAYSYAMHRDIRVPLYGLCNGRKLTVWHVSAAEPVIDVALSEIAAVWANVLGLLGCRSAWPLGIPPGFHPDMGLALVKAGLEFDEAGEKICNLFTSLPIGFAAKLEDGLYCVTGLFGPEDDIQPIVTVDFSSQLYTAFLELLEPALREEVRQALSRQPYRFMFPPGAIPNLMIAATLSDKTITNSNESYRPFVAEEFHAGPDGPPEV